MNPTNNDAWIQNKEMERNMGMMEISHYQKIVCFIDPIHMDVYENTIPNEINATFDFEGSHKFIYKCHPDNRGSHWQLITSSEICCVE